MTSITTGKAVATALAGALLLIGATGAAADVLKCEAGQTAAFGKYQACLSKAEKAFLLKNDVEAETANLAKCIDAFEATWDRLESAALDSGSPCAGWSGFFPIYDFAVRCQHFVSLALAGEPIPDLAECENELTVCEADLSACSADWTTCTYSTRADTEDSADACQADSVTCPVELDACEDDVASCDGIPDSSGPFRTGQTTAHGAGSDGDLQLGTPQSFTDNGDGTITDNLTGLMWEKKDESGGIHDKDNRYVWCTIGGDPGCDTFDMTGPLVGEFLAGLNSGSGFAGHTDWRIPNLNELVTLRRTRRSPSWATHVEFDNGCTPGCSVTECSCTWWTEYWSSSTLAGFPQQAWTLKIGDGMTYTMAKEYPQFARAVRGGS